jgi:hypothetical protein
VENPKKIELEHEYWQTECCGGRIYCGRLNCVDIGGRGWLFDAEKNG